MSFWDDRAQLEKDLKEQGDLEEYEEQGFEFMEAEISDYNDPETGCAIDAYDFLHGWCDVFALELAKLRPDAKAMGIFEYGKLVHAFCEVPNGYIDIRGFCPDFNVLMQVFYDDGLFENMDETIVKPIKRAKNGARSYKNAAQYFMYWYPRYYGLDMNTRPKFKVV